MVHVAARILDAWRCGWLAACERWRQGEPAPAQRKESRSWFGCDPDALPLLHAADDAEAREWYASHFRRGWPR